MDEYKIILKIAIKEILQSEMLKLVQSTILFFRNSIFCFYKSYHAKNKNC